MVDPRCLSAVTEFWDNTVNFSPLYSSLQQTVTEEWHEGDNTTGASGKMECGHLCAESQRTYHKRMVWTERDQSEHLLLLSPENPRCHAGIFRPLSLHLHASWKCFRLSEGLFFYNKSILVWAFFQIEMLFSDKNNPWLKILPNKDAFHHHKIIPVRIFFQIRITPSPKSNPCPNILPNQDYSIAEK